MAQHIKVKIAEVEYSITALTPEYEELIRLAADEVNRRVAGYQSKYRDRSIAEILSFVALNVTMASIRNKRRIEALDKEEKALEQDTRIYLDKFQKDSR